MAKTVIQKVTFKTTPKRLFQIYTNEKEHAAAVNSRVSLVKKVGGRFRAFNGLLQGKMLHLKKDKMIVQTWRGKHWKKKDPDSILTMTFHRVKGGTRVHLTHTNIPDHDYKGIMEGWKKYYWKPWRKYLQSK